MRIACLVLSFCFLLATNCWAEEAEIVVSCRAVSFDDHRDRESGDDDPRPVVLMVIGKIQKSESAQQPNKQLRNQAPTDDEEGEAGPTSHTVNVEVERLLFGSPVPRLIEVFVGTEGRFLHEDADRVSYVYGLVSESQNGQQVYSVNGYFLFDRKFSLSEEKAMRALARARLDFYVLQSKCIFIGLPEHNKKRAIISKSLCSASCTVT